MLKKFVFFLVLSLILPCCKEDNEITSHSHFSKDLVGSWELKNIQDDYWKYFIATDQNLCYRLSSSKDNRHYVSSRMYTITEHQLILDGGLLYIFKVSNDTLTLSEPEKNNVFVRNNNAPTKDEWVIPVSTIKDVPLVDYYMRDMASDGSSFWLTYDDTVKVIDTLGNLLKQYKIENTGGIAYADNKLWISDNDSIKVINSSNGEFISGFKMQEKPYMPIMGLTYENGFVWAVESNGFIYKLKDGTGEILDRLYFPEAHGIEFNNGKLWCTAYYNIFSIDPVTGNAIDTYIIINNQLGYETIGFDGSNFWIGYSGIPYYTLSKVDMK